MEQATMQDLQLGKWLAGAAVGAVVMYMLDPERGRQRRAQSGEKLRQVGRQAGDVFDKVSGEFGARLGQAVDTARGVGQQAGDTLARPGAGDHRDHDSLAVERSRQERSAEGDGAGDRGHEWRAEHHTTHTAGGRSGKADGAAGAIVQPMQNLWQRLGRRRGRRGTALAGGAALSLYAMLSRRSPLALAAGLAGIALLARGAGRRQDSAGLSAASAARPVVIEKTIRIDAPPEQVFDYFAHYENFPRFMSNVIEVRDLGERRSHWVVRGPAGTQFQWNAVLTEHSRPRRLAWESEPGAEVGQTGAILFEPVRNGTRVTVSMSYRPPAGAVGHAIASLLGSDPKRQMDEDLARMKSLVERGTLAHAAGQRTEAGKGSAFLH